MKVLIATWVFPTHGGVFDFLDKVIPYMEAKGHVFHVVAVEPAPRSERSFPHMPRDRIHHVSQLPLPSPFSFPIIGMIHALLRFAMQTRADLIFCQDPFYSGFPSLLASRLLGIRLAMADHGMITNFDRDEYWRNFGFRAAFLWRFLSLLVMGIVVRGSHLIYSPGGDVTERMSAYFGQWAAAKTSTFPIGIDTSVFRPDEVLKKRLRGELRLEGTPVVSFVGRLHVESGLDYLIEAAGLLRMEARPKFLIVGDGALRDEYERAANARTPGSFLFLGYSERTADYLKASDLFVFPKIFAGGYSVALREAMATGLPSVATSGVDSHDSIILTEENGILVPPKDPEAISTAISRLLSDEGYRARIGENARRSIADNFGMEAFHQKVEELLTS